MTFYIKQDGSLLKVGIMSNSGVELFESTKSYRTLEDGMTDVVSIVEMCRSAEIVIKDVTNGES